MKRNENLIWQAWWVTYCSFWKHSEVIFPTPHIHLMMIATEWVLSKLRLIPINKVDFIKVPLSQYACS